MLIALPATLPLTLVTLPCDLRNKSKKRLLDDERKNRAVARILMP